MATATLNKCILIIWHPIQKTTQHYLSSKHIFLHVCKEEQTEEEKEGNKEKEKKLSQSGEMCNKDFHRTERMVWIH